MRKQHQGHKRRSHKKGYKLTLSKAAAQKRAKQAWITKHARYDYASEHPGGGSQRFIREQRSRAQREAALKKLAEDPDFAKLAPHEMDARLAAMYHMEKPGRAPKAAAPEDAETFIAPERLGEGLGLSPEDVRTMSRVHAAQWHNKVVEEARNVAEFNDYKDPEFRNWLRQADPAERLAFQSMVRRARELKTRGRKHFHEPEGKLLDETDLGYEGSGDKGREVRRLMDLTSTESQLRSRDRATAEKVTRSEVERLLGPDLDAIHAKEGPEFTNELISNLVEAQTNANLGERSRAANRAKRQVGRAAVYSQENWEHRRQRDEILRDLEGQPPRGGGPRVPTGPGEPRAPRKGDPRPHDPRLLPTVEDLYAASSHVDKNFGFIRGEVKKLRLRNKPTWEKKRESYYGLHPRPFDQWRKQRNFLTKQEANRRTGAIDGTRHLGLTEDGGLVGLDTNNDKRVAWGISKNADWEYTLNSLESTSEGRKPQYKKRLEYYDQKIRFKEGRRDRDGKLLPGEVDEIADVGLVTKYHDRIVFKEGERTLPRGPQRPPKGVDEVVYVPLRGAAGLTRTIDTGEPKRAYEIRDTQGRWHPVGRSEYAAYVPYRIRPSDSTDEKARKRRENEARVGGRRAVTVSKKIQYRFVDPSQLNLKGGEHDQVSLQIPSFKKSIPMVANVELGDRRVFTNLTPHTKRDFLIGNYVRTKNQRELEERAAKAAQLHDALRIATTQDPEYYAASESERARKMDEAAKEHGFSSGKEMGALAAAAGTAGIYGTRKAVVQGAIPKMANRTLDRLGRTGPVHNLIEKHNIPWENVKIDIPNAYFRPLQEKITGFPDRVAHPLSGKDDFGVRLVSSGFGEMLPREYRERNRFKKMSKQTQKIGQTLDYAREHRLDRGPVGAARNWSITPALRHPDYKNFAAPETNGRYSYLGDQIRFARQYRGDHVRLPSGEVMSVTPTMRNHANRFIHEAQNIASHERTLGNIPARPKGSWKFDLNLMPTQVDRNYAIGAGVIGAAIAGHYAYHKYQEHKKAPEDRIAYYNKILPGALHYKKPYAHVTGTYDIHDVKMPVRWGVGVQDAEFAFRPMDRGYAPNAKLGLTGVRSGKTKGGSTIKSAIFYPRARLQRSYRRGTHDVLVKGHRIPGTLTAGNWSKVERKAVNPSRIDARDREDIIWAFKGTPREAEVKAFYAQSPTPDRIVEMFDDPTVLDRIRKRHPPEAGFRRGGEVTGYRSYIERAPATGGAEEAERLARERLFGLGSQGLI